MATSWTDAGIELLLKWCSGITSAPSLWLFGSELVITGPLVDKYYPMTSSRSGAIATYVTERESNGDFTGTGIDSGLGHDSPHDPDWHLFVKDQVLFDTTGLSVGGTSGQKIYLSSSIEFTR